MPTFDSLAAVAAERLAIASLQAAVVVACVWLLTRRCAALTPSLRAWLWWAVSFKLLLSLAGIPALPLPVLPAHAPAAVGDSAAERAIERTTHDTAPAAAHSAVAASTAGPGGPQEQKGSPALVALIGLWVAGVTAGLGRLAASHRRVRRLVRRSAPVRAETVALAAGIAATLRLRRIPDVRVSVDVQSPQVAGALRSVVLLPESVEQGRAEDLRMALCHELAHVKRRDLLLGWIPVLASRVFFFHPLAHAAAREYALAREAACDSIVLQALRPDPAQYGRLLVRLGVFRGGALVPGATSTSSSTLRRRLEMLNDLRTARGRAPSRWLVVPGIAMVLLPVQLVAGAADAVENRDTARAIAYARADAQAASPQADDTAEAAAAGQRAREETAAAERRAQEETAAAIERVAEQAPRAAEEARARAVRAQTARDAERQAVERRTVALSEIVRAVQKTGATRQFLEQQLRQAREQAERADAIRQETIRLEELRAMQEAIAVAQAARLDARAEPGQQPEVGADASRRYATELQAARRALAELAGAQQSLAAQLETIAQAQETLVREQQSLQQAQQRLVEAQRQLSEALERIDEAVKGNRF